MICQWGMIIVSTGNRSDRLYPVITKVMCYREKEIFEIIQEKKKYIEIN